jgi:hypothetical protein
VNLIRPYVKIVDLVNMCACVAIYEPNPFRPEAILGAVQQSNKQPGEKFDLGDSNVDNQWCWVYYDWCGNPVGLGNDIPEGRLTYKLKPEDFEVVCFSSDSEDFPLEHYETISESENMKDGFVTENQKGFLLTKAGIKKVIAAFENKMDSLIMYYPMNEKVSYKKIIYHQVQHYKRVINEEEKDYKAYYFK